MYLESVYSSTSAGLLFATMYVCTRKAHRSGAMQHGAGKREGVRMSLNFCFCDQVRCDMTLEGEKVLIVGDPKELGAWNSLAGVYIHIHIIYI